MARRMIAPASLWAKWSQIISGLILWIASATAIKNCLVWATAMVSLPLISFQARWLSFITPCVSLCKPINSGRSGTLEYSDLHCLPNSFSVVLIPFWAVINPTIAPCLGRISLRWVDKFKNFFFFFFFFFFCVFFFFFFLIIF